MTRLASGLDGVTFRSHGDKLLGTLFRAAGDGPRPTLVLIHGIPGVEKNTDIAYALRDVGWNVFQFHYRGCWGSAGKYSLTGILDDIAAATDFIAAHPTVDPARLALAGNSLGGWAAIAAGARDSRFRAIVSMCPLVDPRAVSLSRADADEFASMLNGITADEIAAQWGTLTPLTDLAPELAGRPTLLVGAGKDAFFPPDHLRPLAEAAPEIEWQTIEGADHSFSAHRRALVEMIAAWLQKVM
ncbi:MAG: alpha/beta fold hydrolase [Chloroflexi bacterium]|nr:alpha/beta fold hydrolase [Chloroflexota bacterium]